MTLAVVDTDLYVRNLSRRMDFHFGNVTVTEGPQIHLDATVTVGGDDERGMSMGALAPMWFYKNPNMSIDDGVGNMIEVFGAACDVAEEVGQQATPFDLWKSVYDGVEAWADDTSHPPLLWGYGVSLVEQAMLDAFCRATGTSFPTAVHENTLGIDLGVFYDELAGSAPADLLPEEPRRTTAVRHTVGLGDPLDAADLAPEDRLDDGLPQTLTEYVDEQGVHFFKIKLAAEESDFARLKRIRDVIESCGVAEYAFTLDANEQYESVDSFRQQWTAMRDDEELASFLEHLRYVEQPLARDDAFSDATRRAFEEWDDQPPVIIDESDDRLTSLQTALECGYAGTSHKNCKGVFKGLANRCLVEHYRRRDPDGKYLVSGEDLTTLGPVELQQDLAVMATIGADHVERNGHHYYRGLSMFPDDVQEAVLANHGDLYRRHDEGFPTLAIEDGRIQFDSVVDAPFGRAIDLDPSRFTHVDDWRVESIYD